MTQWQYCKLWAFVNSGGALAHLASSMTLIDMIFVVTFIWLQIQEKGERELKFGSGKTERGCGIQRSKKIKEH